MPETLSQIPAQGQQEYKDFIYKSLENNLVLLPSNKVIKEKIGRNCYVDRRAPEIRAVNGSTFANSLVSFLGHEPNSPKYGIAREIGKYDPIGGWGWRMKSFARKYHITRKDGFRYWRFIAYIDNGMGCEFDKPHGFSLNISPSCTARERELMLIWNEIREDFTSEKGLNTED